METPENIVPRQEGIETLEAIVKENFNRWNDALLTKDSETVARLYAKDATFLPTLSGEFKKGREGAKEYFKHFLEKSPSGEIIKEEVQLLGEEAYCHSGMYNFKIGPDDNRQTVEARFTLLWKKDEQGNWNIIHHHSSLKPKE